MQNVEVTDFASSELLREKKRGGGGGGERKNTPHPDRLEFKPFLLNHKNVMCSFVFNRII